MAIVTISATTNGASSSSGALVADSQTLVLTGNFGAKQSGGTGATCEIQISDDGTNWATFQLETPGGSTRITRPMSFWFPVRAALQWRLFCFDMIAGSTVRAVSA